MVINVAFAAEIFFPLMAIISGIKLRVNPYRVVTVGTLYAVFGAFITVLAFSIFGNSIGSTLDASWQDAMKILSSVDYGESVDKETMLAAMNEAYDSFVTTIPATFFMWGAVVSYIEYLIISNHQRKKGTGALKMTPVRDFNLSKGAVMGWCLMCIAAALLNLASDSAVVTSVYQNTYALFRMVFAYQGMSLLAFACDRRGWNRAVWIVVTILLLLTGFGTAFIYFAGLIDGIFGLKGRFVNRK